MSTVRAKQKSAMTTVMALFLWRPREDLNLWPLPPQGSALSAELLGHVAGREGFEPSRDIAAPTHLAGGRTRPDYATSPHLVVSPAALLSTRYDADESAC
jgi:hypothetical protein